MMIFYPLGDETMMQRKYIEVLCRHTEDGKIVPVEIIWGDGRRFEIDRVLEAKQSCEMKTGGLPGWRYTCRVMGKQVDLWLEGDSRRWFMELESGRGK